MDEFPLAYFITWRTYGTWLPGDARRWAKNRRGMQVPDVELQARAVLACRERPLVLNHRQRRTVEATIREHCRIRRWQSHAERCLSNHVHAVVSAPVDPQVVMGQLKAWCTRRLRELSQQTGCEMRKRWWAERGSKRYIYNEDDLARAVFYVQHAQDEVT